LETVEPPPITRSARKRAAILDAATHVFLEKGYLGTSVDEIAAVASVSKRTVYQHFGDKQASLPRSFWTQPVKSTRWSNSLRRRSKRRGT
jgi:hypothetical protein